MIVTSTKFVNQTQRSTNRRSCFRISKYLLVSNCTFPSSSNILMRAKQTKPQQQHSPAANKQASFLHLQGPQHSWGTHAIMAASGECLWVSTSAFQHTATVPITVPNVNCTYGHQPPTTLYLHAKFQLQTCCTSWDIVWWKSVNHPASQSINQSPSSSSVDSTGPRCTDELNIFFITGIVRCF